MIKQELVEIIAAEHHLPKQTVNEIFRTLCSTVKGALVRGEKVVFVGFGTFQAVLTGARVGQNPHTGEQVRIEASRRPRFVAGRELRRLVRDGSADALGRKR
jgi:nucleoid DNA-binding protein